MKGEKRYTSTFNAHQCQKSGFFFLFSKLDEFNSDLSSGRRKCGPLSFLKDYQILEYHKSFSVLKLLLKAVLYVFYMAIM